MNFEPLGNIGEFVGGIGVAASLIYLAVQIRQNSRHVQASIEQARAQALREGMESDYVIDLARDEGTVAIWLEGRRSLEGLDDVERARFSLLMGGIVGRYESNMLMHQQGFLTDERWQSQRNALRALLSDPGAQSWWKLFSFHFTPSFRAIVDRDLRVASNASPAAV